MIGNHPARVLVTFGSKRGGTAGSFVTRNAAQLQQRPVWMFSSGPVDATAASGEIPA